MTDTRQFMRKGEKITLCEENTGNKKTFTIITKDGTGASSVSYVASCGRKSGRLKEFYPCDDGSAGFFSISRNVENQLTQVDSFRGGAETFDKMLSDYIEAYHMLDEAKRNAEKGNNSFSTFIPSFEIYKGIDENGNASGAYIWTQDNDGDFETFEEYLKKVHKNPGKNPAREMFTILKALYNLTECIKILHMAGLIHSDIKPSNFGFPIRNGRHLTEQVQLFDINSIYSVYTKFHKFVGTPGFCAPEISKGKISNQSDLYSIGATLFNAVALCDDVPDAIYDDKYYDNIDDIVANSKLLNASPITSSSRFQLAVSKILKICLAKELRNRVDNCDELKEYLQKASVLLIPAQYNDLLDLGVEIKLIDKELEKYNDTDSWFALQCLLFNHPIYETQNEKIKILVVGCGVYGQQFIDLCLQVGQVADKKLELYVVSQDKESYKKEYLDKRPALKDFFEIDGEGDTSETKYGRIVFISPEEISNNPEYKKGFSKGNTNKDKKHNKKLAQELILDKIESSYVFISLGDEELNEMVADTCYDIVSDLNIATTITYVSSSTRKRKKKSAYPVNVYSKASEIENFSEIERMAYNTHFIWNSPLKLNVDEKKFRKDFKNKYNYNSSVACVLAIKYKLHLIGIEMDELSGEKINVFAEKFNERIKKDEKEFAKLVNIEHRRWVVEKITQGWTCRTDYSGCVYDGINDKRKKQHPCIVKSTTKFVLDEKYKNPTTGKCKKDKWDKPCEDDALLDDLDKVSINLHRTFYENAQGIKLNYSLNGEETKRIQNIIKDDKAAVIAFNEWMLCLKRIWNKDETQIRFYDTFKNSFLQTVSNFKKREYEDIVRYIKTIDSKAIPIILEYSMRDYKQSDKDLIKSIPFILTHKQDIKLFIPLMTKDNTERFNNVAAVTLINPGDVTYAVYIRSADEIKNVVSTIKYMVSYLNKKEIKSKLRFIIVYDEMDTKTRVCINDLKTEVKNIDKTRIKQVVDFSISDEGQIAPSLNKYADFDAYEYNTAHLSALLKGADFYKLKPNYSFSSAHKKFEVSDNCKWLTYIKGNQFLTVPDMLSFKNSNGNMATLPEYHEYKTLWKFYRENSYAWKDMCNALCKFSEGNDRITSFNSATDLTNTKVCEYVVPNELRDGYNYVVSFLRDKAGVIGIDSRVEYRTTESCCVIIYVGSNNVESVKKLFADPRKFMNQKDISIVTKPKKIEIYFDSLVVNELNIDNYPESKDSKKKIGELLTSLQSAHYIFNLKNTENKVFSFVYSTRQAKQLLTSAGRMLEIYVYHKLQSAGFSDVVTGYEINWGDSSVKSEFDCIVTSGFRSVLIECKAQDKISQDYYYKLYSLAKQFGINAVPVLIADTHEKADRDNSLNEMQRERGEMLGVYTIYDRDEINKIDDTIRKILKDNY